MPVPKCHSGEGRQSPYLIGARIQPPYCHSRGSGNPDTNLMPSPLRGEGEGEGVNNPSPVTLSVAKGIEVGRIGI